MVHKDCESAHMSCHPGNRHYTGLDCAPQVVVIQRAQRILLVGSKDGELVLHIAYRHAGHKNNAQLAA